MSDIDFDAALAPLEPKNTARMILFGVKVNSPRDVVLIGVHAGGNNERFQSLNDKLAAKHQVALVSGDLKSKRALADEMFAEIYSKTVITGWENVCDAEGKPARFTVDACVQFLAALRRKRPDIAKSEGAIEGYFRRPGNFADGYAIADVEALGEG